jgi:hypothetical protein
LLKFRPSTGVPALRRALPVSKNDAEVAGSTIHAQSRYFLAILAVRPRIRLRTRRENLTKLAVLYAQTAKKHPNWLNMSANRKSASRANQAFG